MGLCSGSRISSTTLSSISICATVLGGGLGYHVGKTEKTTFDLFGAVTLNKNTSRQSANGCPPA